ncbi:MAG TPA: nuclear transport factor 2 family protein [Terriglobales bacterium]|nr:nuclear transport factor 2 family protein [Terriglobales bacterium]
MSICTFCGHTNDQGNKFCGLCGTPLPEGALRRQPAAKADPAAVKPAHGAAPQPLPPATAKEDAAGQHHYHHHYHHHFFPNDVESGMDVGVRAASGASRDLTPARAPLSGPAMSRGEATIRKITQDLALACNTKQLNDLVELYAPDAVLLRSNFAPIRGSAAIREFFVGQLEAGLGEVEMETIRVELYGDAAYESGRCKMLVPSAAGKRREDRGKYLIFYARQKNGDWKVMSDCWASDLSLPLAAEEPGKAAAAVRKP